MNVTDATSAPVAPGRPPITIKVIGVGGAGGNAVDHLSQAGLTGVTFIAANTDAQALAHTVVADKLALGAKSRRGLGTGGDPELGRAAAEEDAEKIRSLCAGADIVFVVAGLGGGTGTGAGPVIAQIAKETEALVLGIVTLPFEFEGSRRQRQALLGLQQLKAVADGVICLPNQKVFKLVDANTSLVETFRFTNELLAQGVRGIWRLLLQRGLIQIDFADLCAVTRGRHAESSLATAEAAGEHRAREVVEKVLAHPLLDSGQVLAEADAVLVSLVGGPDLTMAEVNRVMEQINRQSENAHLIFGAAIDETFTGRLSVTLLASHQNERPTARMTPPASSRPESEATSGPAPADAETGLFPDPVATKPAPRFVPPPPPLSPEHTDQLYRQQRTGAGRGRKNASRLRQGTLPLEVISKGRFEKSEPTIHHGEDLDVPTYIRRGVALN